MKLAEALTLRSDAQKRFEQLRARSKSNARYQEGEKPAEDAKALVAEAMEVLTELERLIRQINKTNAATLLDNGESLTDALAARDVLGLRHRMLTEVADAASGADQVHMGRQMRSELKFIAAVKVPDLRNQADEVARRLRELDVRIQQANWDTELIED